MNGFLLRNIKEYLRSLRANMKYSMDILASLITPLNFPWHLPQPVQVECSSVRACHLACAARVANSCPSSSTRRSHSNHVMLPSKEASRTASFAHSTQPPELHQSVHPH